MFVSFAQSLLYECVAVQQMFDKDQSIVCFVAVVRTVKVNLIVLLIGCTLQAGLFLSCERTRRAGSDQGPAMLRERVNALQFETLGPVDLGNASAAPTDNTVRRSRNQTR